MQFYKYPEREEWEQLLKRPALDNAALENTVVKVLNAVKQNGDQAVKDFTLQFDKVVLEQSAVTAKELDQSGEQLSPELKAAIAQARHNIEMFHQKQQQETVETETMPGVRCWRKSLPIEKVGLYIPGGTAPLFSTILMLGIPARIAGCKEIILCTPPDSKGNVHPAILYTAQLTGIQKIFKVGGVQAIAAMAYGTESIPRVYKIFGPGNQYVTCAKQLVNKEGVAIDMPAGPSEVAVLADDSANPEFVAADLLSQAEHGVDSQVLLVTTSENLLNEVTGFLAKQLETLPRKELAKLSLANSRMILAKNIETAMEMINIYAPEHLILSCNNEERIAENVINAGSVFLGNYSPESAGDYASGTNHTLPTNGHAKAHSGVSLDSFVKKVTFQKLSPEGLRNIAGTVELMAEAEGLIAHKNAVSIRLKNIK